MAAPRRIQRKRRRGWRMPAGAVYVGRPTVWGNPFRVTRSSDFHGLPGSWFVLDDSGAIHHPDEDTQFSARQKVVDLYADLVAGGRGPVTEATVRAELAGHDLVCWCPIDQACHADVLLRIAGDALPTRIHAATATRPRCPRCGGAETSAAAVAELDPRAGHPRRVTCGECGRSTATD